MDDNSKIHNIISQLTLIKNQYVPSYMPQHRAVIDEVIEILTTKENS